MRIEQGQCWTTTPRAPAALPRTRTPSWWWGAGALALGLLVLLLAGCGLSADSVRELEGLRAGAEAVAQDPTSSERERETCRAVADALAQALYATGDLDELPDDVRARREARRKAASPEAPR